MNFKIAAGAVALMMLAACNHSPEYDATGIFEATTVTVAAETSGRLLSVAVEEGDSVVQGAKIAVVDTAILVLQQKQLATQRGAAESTSPDIAAQAAALRSQIAHQEHECDRYGRLLADGATTQKQYDDARAALTTLRGQLTALLSTLGKSRASVSDNALALLYQSEQVEEMIEKSIINSPLDGTVLEKYAETGEYTLPGKPICKIANLDNTYLRAYFTVGQLAHLSLGQEVRVIADFGGDERYEYPGRIIWIAQESEFTPKNIQTRDSRSNLVYAVKVSVANDGRIKLGQYGEVIL